MQSFDTRQTFIVGRIKETSEYYAIIINRG